jgi:hypothetical protein
VREHWPEFHHWVSHKYGKRAELWVRVGTTEDGVVQQGDPLVPFLFALVMHHRLLLPARTLMQNQGTIAAYLDDVKIIGPPERIAAAFEYIRREGPKYGLRTNERKCAIFSNDNPMAEIDRLSPAALPKHGRSMKMLGCMIGAAAEVGEFLKAKLTKLTKLTKLSGCWSSRTSGCCCSLDITDRVGTSDTSWALVDVKKSSRPARTLCY